MANNIVKLLTALLTEFQSLSDAMHQVYIGRFIDVAVGAQLEVLGKIVGQEREGVEDDELYRRYIRARISANRSTGLISDMLTIADLVVYDDDATYELQNQGAAAFVLYVRDIVSDYNVLTVLIEFLRDAVSAGVRPIVQGNMVEAVDAFCFFDGVGKGFASLPRLDLAPLTTNVDTRVKYRDTRHADEMPTLALVADGTGAGSFTNTDDAWTFHFESGVTTVAQFEAAVDATTHLSVAISDGVGTMGAGDVLAATAFTATVGGRLASARD